MRQVFRADPKLPVQSMKTYQLMAPKNTHFRPASCEEVNCASMQSGWKSVIDESTDLGKRQAHYIRNTSGRHYTEDRNQAPGLTTFTFEPGQRCFRQHQVRLDKPEIYLVRNGDWRGNPGLIRRHMNCDDWVDDFANHQQKLADVIEKG